MFGFGKIPEVAPLFIEGNQLTFASANGYKIGKSIKIKLVLVCQGKLHSIPISLITSSVEQRPDETFEVTGLMQVEGKKLQELTTLLMYGGVKGADRRGSKRIEYAVRVLSRDLPSFRGVTVNVNREGADLQLYGPIAVGYDMNLGFDLELVGSPEVIIPTVCIWSREDVDENRRTVYRAGIVLGDGSTKAMSTWRKFYQRLLDAEGSSVMQKTIDGGEITVQSEEAKFASHFQNDASKEEESLPESSVFAPTSFSPAPTFGASSPGFNEEPKPVFSQEKDERLRIEYKPNIVPQAHELGAGFASQEATFAPEVHGKLQLPGSEPTDGFPKTSSVIQPLPQGSGQPLFTAEGSSGFNLPVQPGGGFRLPLGSVSSPGSDPSVGGEIRLPLGLKPPASHSPSPGSGFQLPLDAGSPASHSPSPGSGFQLPLGAGPPASPNPSPGSGFQLPLGAGPPASPNPSPGGGFQLPLGAGPPASPNPSSGGGFQRPPASAPFSSPDAGFQLPFSSQPSGKLSFSVSESKKSEKLAGANIEPELVKPIGIRGATLTYLCKDSLSNVPGKQKIVQLAFEIDGKVTKVPVTVSLVDVDSDRDGGTVCVATVLEDKEKVQILNQLIAPIL